MFGLILDSWAAMSPFEAIVVFAVLLVGGAIVGAIIAR